MDVTVNAMLAETMQTDVVCVSAKRLKRKGAALGHVLVQLSSKEGKLNVFRAKGKLRNSPIGIDDDLAQLQQQRKNATWPKFKDCRARGVRMQWQAEKLFVKEGNHFVLDL